MSAVISQKDIDRQTELKELCKPLNEWLQKNYDPHTKIIIENDHAEVVSSIIGVPFKVLD
jgi:hypothetical protein